MPGDIGSKLDGPSQPTVAAFPCNPTISKRKTNHFNSSWYSKHKWISYKVFCFACALFGSSSTTGKDRFTRKGFDDWSHAVGDPKKGLDGHALSTSHRNAMVKWESFQINSVTIEERLNPCRPALVQQNRDYFTKVIKYIRWFCLQEVAFRRKYEHDGDSDNRGNFRELMELELHPEFQTQREAIMKQYSVHNDYLSKTIFNDFIFIMASEVKSAIFEEVVQVKFFTVIADECKEFSKSEQMSLCLRYSIGSRPTERFVTFTLSEGSFTAEVIAKEIGKLVTELVEIGCILTGLAADGASVMSGELSGVQAQLKTIHPHLIYIHCVAHRLNLVIVNSLSKCCVEILTIVDKLHSVFNSAKTNDVFAKIQKENKVNVHAVPERSETRWSSMFFVLDILCSPYQEILLTLFKRGNDTDEPAVTCAGLCHKMASGKMILTCVILKNVFAATTNLSDILRNPHLEWSSAVHEIGMTRKLLGQLKSGASLSSVVGGATVISEKCSIPLNITSPVYSIRSHIGTAEVSLRGFTKDFTTKMCNKILDEMLLRFPLESMIVLAGIDSLNPRSARFLEEKLLLQLVDYYGADTLQINRTLLVFEVRKYKLSCESSNQGNSVIINPDHHPNLMKLFHLKRSLPVSSAEAERSFSTMKRVKSYLRNRLTDEKLAELCLLSSERDLTKKLNIDRIIDIFNDKPRRVAL